MMDRLLREGNPPTGQLASPKPQYKKPGVNEYEPVEGQHGAPFAILKDASGNIVSPATEATLEQVRALLSGVASGPIVVKQEVVLARGIYTATTQRVILDKPPEARGLHLFCRVHGRTGMFGEGQGMSLACVFNRGVATPGVTSYGLHVRTDRTTANYVGHHIFIGPDFVGLGDAQGDFANVKVSPMVLTTNLNFQVFITGTFGEGEGYDMEVIAVWVR